MQKNPALLSQHDGKNKHLTNKKIDYEKKIVNTTITHFRVIYLVYPFQSLNG